MWHLIEPVPFLRSLTLSLYAALSSNAFVQSMKDVQVLCGVWKLER